MTGEDHQDARLYRLALKEDDLLPLTGGGRNVDRFCLLPDGLRFTRGAFAFLEDVGREITRLAELADGFVSRIGIDQAGRFLSARVKSYVGVTRHM